MTDISKGVTVEISYKNIVLRDFCESDIADEIRWSNVETAWMTADTPWEPVVPIDKNEPEAQMLRIISETPADALRPRLEIEAEGKHIGFVCSYPLGEDFEPVTHRRAADAKIRCALGIEICEPAFWGRGLGARALAAAITYYQNNGFKHFYLETWSGNKRMLKCAERFGFYVANKKPAFRQANGKNYDAVFLRLNDKKFKAYLDKNSE